MDVWVGIYKTRAFPEAQRVGLERDINRRQYEELNQNRQELLNKPAVVHPKSKPRLRISRALAK